MKASQLEELFSIFDCKSNPVIILRNGEFLYCNEVFKKINFKAIYTNIPESLGCVSHVIKGKKYYQLADSYFSLNITNCTNQNISIYEFTDETTWFNDILPLLEDNALEKQMLKANLANEANILLEREIEKHKQTKAELLNNQKISRNVFKYSINNIITSDVDGNILAFSDSSPTTFGFTKEEMENMHIDDLYANDAERTRVFISIEEQGEFNGEIKNKKKDGSIFFSHLSSSAIFDEDNNVSGYVGISRDISEEIEARKIIEDQNSKLESLFENKSDILIWILDENLRLTSKNSKLDQFSESKLNVKWEIGDNFVEKLTPFLSDKAITPFKNFYNKTTNGTAVNFEGILHSHKGKIWLNTYLSPIKTENKNKCEIAAIALDITDKKEQEIEISKSLKEKEVLLQEVHHRVKNNLQVISSILNLQSAQSKDKKVLHILRESKNRVKSMAFIHESLYRSSDFANLNFKEYIHNIVTNVIHSYENIGDSIQLDLDLSNVVLHLDQAIPCGLIVNELVSNAIKYAFNGIDNPKLSIQLKEEENIIKISVIDNGIGLPADFVLEDSTTLGLQLVDALRDQIDAELEIDSFNGTKYLITFANKLASINSIKKI